jgi:hypothetical protein
MLYVQSDATKYRTCRVDMGQRVYTVVFSCGRSSCGVHDAAAGSTYHPRLDTTHHHLLSIMQSTVTQTTCAAATSCIISTGTTRYEHEQCEIPHHLVIVR